jgi:hypothetical protein
MERRDRSLEALKKLRYIDSLDYKSKPPALASWVEKYIKDGDTSIFEDCTQRDLEELSELFYKNIKFLKDFTLDMRKDLDQTKKIKAFIS